MFAPWNPTTPYYTFTSSIMGMVTITGYVNKLTGNYNYFKIDFTNPLVIPVVKIAIP